MKHLTKFLLWIGLLSWGLLTVQLARAQTPVEEPTPAPPAREQEGGMVPTPDRLAMPTMPAHPTQADQGALVYYYVCMPCHGDQGQGLTPEWLESWGLDKNACWASKCHASNHPPEGFTLPKSIPPVVGPIIPARFATVLDLHDFVATKMPWQAPASLKEDEYWQLTAFLARQNGTDPGIEPLTRERAAKLRLRPLAPTPTPLPDGSVGGWYWGAMLAGVGVLTLAVLFILVRGRAS